MALVALAHALRPATSLSWMRGAIGLQPLYIARLAGRVVFLALRCGLWRAATTPPPAAR